MRMKRAGDGKWYLLPAQQGNEAYAQTFHLRSLSKRFCRFDRVVHTSTRRIRTRGSRPDFPFPVTE